MPRRDGTGPSGAGAKTGWGMGNCIQETNERSNFDRGFFCRMGRGRGFFPRRRFADPADSNLKTEITVLEERLSYLKSLLKKD